MKANKRIRDLTRRRVDEIRTYVVAEGNKYYVTTVESPDPKRANHSLYTESVKP